MIKKMFGVSVVMLVLLVSVAHANIYVAWNASAGFYFDVAPLVGILGDASGNSTIAQLIWSPDATFDLATADVANDYLEASGNDVMLGQTTITENGVLGDFDEFAYFLSELADDGGANGTGGFVYGRIFQDDTIDVGDWVYFGQSLAVLNLDPLGVPADSPQTYEFNTDLINGDAVDGVNAQQVVPEPASFLLFGLGAVIIGLRRKRKK